MLHVARGYSLRETVVRAKLANWADISDVALLKRLRNSEEWLRLLCIELLHQAPRWVFILSSLIAGLGGPLHTALNAPVVNLCLRSLATGKKRKAGGHS
jgi:hypothetical protein